MSNEPIAESMYDKGERAADAMKEQQAVDDWDNLCEFTEILVGMNHADRLQAIIDQPNQVERAIDILGWRAGMSKELIMPW